MRYILFLWLLLIGPVYGSTIIERAAITTNMENFRPINDLKEIDDDYKLVYFFVEFKRPISQQDRIQHSWEVDGKVLTRQPIITTTKSKIWWNVIYISRHGTWNAVVAQDGQTLLKNTFVYGNFISEDEMYEKHSFNELLNLKKNQRCAETLQRLSGQQPKTKYSNFILQGWRKKCVFKNYE